MKIYSAVILFVMLVCASPSAAAEKLDFTLHKLESARAGGTLLVVAGIQGDEPGGFNAAALLVTHYRILKGSVWVIPNLNFISIIKRSRGVYGDLNRKFASVPDNDPEYKTIEKVKDIILDDRVDVILNLHDGSGFYRPEHIDRMHNPARWGQSVIIDQQEVNDTAFGDLDHIASRLVEGVNRHLFSQEHTFRVKNTETRLGDVEMEKTLTYFAVRNGKSALGLEVSKAFPTHQRSYYHLRMLEAMMDLLGIEYERRFALTARGVRQAISSDINVVLYDNKIFLDMYNARNRLGFVPLKKDAAIEFTPSNPLLTIVNAGGRYRVYHGNRRLTWLQPEYFDYDSSIDSISMLIDGHEQDVSLGGMVHVEDSFAVVPRQGYRVNVIGFKKPGIKNESGIAICKDDILHHFSVDRGGRVYRVEVYRGRKFSGMVLVSFDGRMAQAHRAEAKKLSMLQR